MIEKCECAVPGFCPVFKRNMPKGLHHRCQTSQPHRNLFERQREGKPLRTRATRDKNRLPGPGSILKWLIFQITGEEPTAGCACDNHAREMDSWGWKKIFLPPPPFTNERRETIYGWLKDEATARSKEVSRAGFFPLLITAYREYRRKVKEKINAVRE